MRPTRAPDSEDASLDITFPAEADRIAPIVDQVAELARTRTGDSGKDMEIALALTEALANAVRHGSNNDPSKTVVCRVWVNGGGDMTIIVRDSGPGFDPDRVPDPTQGDALGSDHGRGIYMIRQLMDEVRFEHHGTELQMKKKL